MPPFMNRYINRLALPSFAPDASMRGDDVTEHGEHADAQHRPGGILDKPPPIDAIEL